MLYNLPNSIQLGFRVKNTCSIKMVSNEGRVLREMTAGKTERLIQREQRDSQQARALSLTLRELQQSMDPLIAAQFYNNRFCPLFRLPEELLLHILSFLADDPVTLHCLQAVSRTFLRLLHRKSNIWRDEWYIDPTDWRRAQTRFLKVHLKRPFRLVLQRDGRCDNCRRWNHASPFRPFDECKFDLRQGWPVYMEVHCGPCDTLHDVRQFSKYNEELWFDSQPCLGQEGSVQLCEHVQIRWASIAAHIDDWRRQHRGKGDWEACLDSFNIECRHASHDTRCTASEAPTWPRARLRTATGFSKGHVVVLSLEWAPHSRIDSLNLTTDGRIPAHELRARFQRLRQLGPAETLYPPCRPGALPELACISASCPFIYYRTGQDGETAPPLLPFGWSLWSYCKSILIDHGTVLGGRTLDITPHYLKNAGDTGISSQCLVARYVQNIPVCTTTAMMDPTIKIIPNDRWLHAMDTDTYPHPQACGLRPQCRDETCVNYYRRRKDYCDYTWTGMSRADDVGVLMELGRWH